MAVYFFDSSAIVKRYLKEKGTGWVNIITDQSMQNRIYVARVTLVEVVSAITRKTHGGGLNSAAAAIAIQQFRYDFATEYIPVELTPVLINAASLLAESHALRGYDAVQLAAALEINNDPLSLGLSTVTLISVDVSLNSAGIVEGLAVDDPNSHP